MDEETKEFKYDGTEDNFDEDFDDIERLADKDPICRKGYQVGDEILYSRVKSFIAHHFLSVFLCHQWQHGIS